MSAAELACSYAATILHDDDISITAEKIAKLIKAANVQVESFWPVLFAKLAEKRNLENLILSAGAGGAAPVALSASAVVAQEAAAEAAAPAADEKKEPVKEEESDDDMGFSLFD